MLWSWDEFSSDVEVDGVLSFLSVSCWELSTETALSCACTAASVKWAFRRSRLKNFSLSSFTVNSSVRVVMGMKLGPFASKALSSSPNRRSSALIIHHNCFHSLLRRSFTTPPCKICKICNFLVFNDWQKNHTTGRWVYELIETRQCKDDHRREILIPCGKL